MQFLAVFEEFIFSVLLFPSFLGLVRGWTPFIYGVTNFHQPLTVKPELLDNVGKSSH
jgi:hypothetical protein